MQQLLGNLVENAVHYGTPEGTVRVAVVGGEDDIRIDVANRPALDTAILTDFFEPLKRGTSEGHQPGLGLGLYIVREIAKAHGGSAEARSDGTETILDVRLPRRR